MAVEAAKERRNIRRDPALDCFWTPEWATRELLQRELFPRWVWEPACGAGHISTVLEEYGGYAAWCTDIADHSPGTPLDEPPRDFLTYQGPPTIPESDPARPIEAMVTNPPFTLATAFVDHAVNTLKLRKVAIFARVAMLEGAERHEKLFQHQLLSRVWVFSRRVTMAHKDWQNAPEKGGQMACAWFVFERGHRGGTIGWIS